MTFSIVIGWWAVPLLISICLAIWVIPRRASEHPSGGFIPDFAYMAGLWVRLTAAVIASLVCWLIWALLGAA